MRLPTCGSLGISLLTLMKVFCIIIMETNSPGFMISMATILNDQLERGADGALFMQYPLMA
jgi:hypothetical protein